MRDKRPSHSIRELMDGSKEEVKPDVRMPRYTIHHPKFYCPISPYIMWNHNLMFGACPVCPAQRDMSDCAKCIYKTNKNIIPQKEKKTPIVEVVKKDRVPIPKIGKTYTSK